jgi:hypothetical protein
MFGAETSDPVDKLIQTENMRITLFLFKANGIKPEYSTYFDAATTIPCVDVIFFSPKEKAARKSSGFVLTKLRRIIGQGRDPAP